MKINKYLKYIVELIGLVLIVIVILINLEYNVRLKNAMSENIIIEPNSIIMAVALIITIIAFYYIFYKANMIKINKKAKKIILIELFVIYLIAQIIWINVRDANPNYDQYYVYDTAIRIKENNENLVKDEYLQMYPQQISTASFFALVFKIFNTTNVRILQYINAIANTFTILGLYFIAKNIANKENPLNTVAFLVISFTFTAIPLLSTFIYGDFISLPFAIFAVYYAMKYTESNKIRYILCSAILMSVSYFLRMNTLIFTLAIIIYLFLEMIQFISIKLKEKSTTKKNKVFEIISNIVMIIIFIAINILPTNIYKAYMQDKLQLDKEKSFPIVGFLDIGINRSTRGYGWYIDSIGDDWKAGKIDKEDFKQNIEIMIDRFKKKPKSIIEFYTKKIASMWAESTCGSIWYNLSFNFGNMSLNEGTATEDQIQNYEKVDNQVLTFYNLNRNYEKILIMFIFFAVLMFVLLNKEITNNQILLIIIFIGGFLFHFLWEAKSRYIIPYIIILIPIASIGINKTAQKFLRFIRKRKEYKIKKQEV